MVRKYLKLGLRFISIFVCVLFMASFFVACSSNKDVQTYAISGYILDENNTPVEGVSVDGGEYGVAVTNAEGVFSFKNIKNGLIISPSKEGYHFEIKSKAITSAKANANFVASKEYTVTGTIANNGNGLSGEVIYFSSLANPTSDNCVVTSDENGNFVISGVAGKTKVSYAFNGGNIIDEATINESTVNLELTSSIRLAFEFDTTNVNTNEIDVKIGGKSYELDKDYEIDESNLKFNDLVEISSSTYDFDITRFNLSNQYDYKVIKAYKKYTVTGLVKSGDFLIENADVFVNGVYATSTNSNGEFEIANLSKEKTVSVYYSNLNFESVSVDKLKTQTVFNGTKNVKLSMTYDYAGLDELVFDGVTATTANKIDYELKNVHLGDTVNFSSTVYHLNQTNFVVSANDVYFAEGFVKYNAEVSGPDVDYELYIDGEPSIADNLVGLYGNHTITAKYENYIFDEYEISAPNRVVNLEYKIPYSVTIAAKSGELVLSNAKAVIAGTEISADQNGKIELENLVESVNVQIVAEGYNSLNLVVSSADEMNEKTANLSYNISGYAKTGNIAVAYASVSVGDKTAITNTIGYFEINEIFGAQQVKILKTNNSFNPVDVSKSAEIVVQGTFKIFGVLENDEGFVANKTITLIPSNESSSELTTTSNEYGYYEFTGLSEKYTLTSADTSSTELLRPYSYIVTLGGEYNFRSTGFSISGKITTGGAPIEGVLVKAGSSIVYTDEQGKYEFGLLSTDCEVSAEKEGYVFSDSVVVSDTAENIDFTATYSVSGMVSTNGVPVQGVAILVNSSNSNILTDADGKFTLSGLTGANNVISYEKSGIVFDSTNTVSGVCSLAVSCKVQVNISAKTGSIDVLGFDYFVNGLKQGTATQNQISLTANHGDIITFEKTGYVFENATISFEQNYIVNSTYSVVGYTLSNDVTIEGVAVKVGSQTILSDMSGKFAISGLSGEVSLTFEKQGFEFEQETISSYQSNLVVNGFFTVTGEVKVIGNTPLEGVGVYHLGRLVDTTNAEGKFTATGISGYYTLAFVKDGYNISSIETKYGSQHFVVVANYSISGVVMSGNLVLAGAKVDLYLDGSNIPKSTTTNENGYYEFENIETSSKVVVSKSGYNSAESSAISNFVEQNFDLSYRVTLTFTKVSGVTVWLNDTKFTASGNSITLAEVKGASTIKLEKTNNDFGVYNEFTISSPNTLEIDSSESYNVKGYVKSKSSKLAVVGVTVQAGTKTTVTDSNGYFEFESAAGTLQIKESGIDSNKITIDHDGDYSSQLTITESEFAILLVNRGYANLDSASSVQIFGNGVVSTDMEKIAGAQYVASMYKRDTKGNILKQNLNSGSATAGIDPNVALLVYKKMPTVQGGNPSYSYIKHQTVSTNGTTTVNIYPKSGTSLESTTVNIPTADYNPSDFTASSADTLKATFGSSPEEYTSASIIGATCSKVSFDGTYYTFMLSLNLSQPNYKNQIQALSPGSTHDLFNKLNHYYKINKNGWIVSLNTDENYKITQNNVPILGTQSVVVDSDIVYTFHTQNKNTAIADIDASSTSAIKNSLALSVQTVAASCDANLATFDIVTKVIYG